MSLKQSPLGRRREEHARRLTQAVETLRQRVSEMPDVRRASLFGSYARGRADLFTDLDVLLVIETDEPMLDRLARVYSALALPVDADVLCYTPAEFELLREGAFLKHILRDEVVLYEKNAP